MDLTTILLGGIASLGAAVSFLFGLLIKSLNDRLAEKDAQIASYKSILQAALFAGDKATNELMALKGLPMPAPLAPILPEHQSPVTPKQADTAHIATERARVVAQYVALGIEPVKMDDIAD